MSDLVNALLEIPKKQRKELLSVRVPKNITDRLAVIAEKTGRTKAEVVITLLSSGLSEIEAQL